VEPGFHVTEAAFAKSINSAESIGLELVSATKAGRGRSAVLVSP
jgi:hypothetical protein